MPRAPFQVVAYPYRRDANGNPEYCLFRRSDAGWWQGISGGGEDDETPFEAVRREASEEAGIPAESSFLRLDAMDSVPVTEFRDSSAWGEDVYVIPKYTYGVAIENRAIVLSSEHTEHAWVGYAEAYQMLEYDGDKTALWELNRRLLGRGPRG